MSEDYVEALISELVQVAAVAFAGIQDLKWGDTDLYPARVAKVTGMILDERASQEEKWGSQHHGATFWMAILGEEFGEACQEALRSESDAIAAADAAKRNSR